jgi:hypothetical protein
VKKELFFLIGLSSAIYATQDISCVEFVNLQKAEAKSYIDNYRKGFELNHFKTKNHTDRDKQYIGMQGGVSKYILTCLDLRRVTYYGVGDVRRALILTSLSKKSLTQEEQNIYQKSLSENIAFYSAYSKSSLFNAKYMPLIYLTIQRSKDKKYYIIYEFRKNGAEIKRYSKKILVSQSYIKFNDINVISNQNYLDYLNSNKINANLKINRHYQEVRENRPKRVIRPPIFPTIQHEEEYMVLKSFEAVKILDNQTYQITNEFSLTKLNDRKKRVYFSIGNEEYYASKKWWKQATKKVGEVQ